jgi:hypothetical protein
MDRQEKESEDVDFDDSAIQEAVRAKKEAIKKSGKEESYIDKLRMVTTGKYLISTVMLAYSAFTLNFLFYGGLYGFPQVLSQLGDKTSMKPAISLIVAASFEIPGCLIGIYLGLKFKRKPALLLFLIATTFFTLCFIAGVQLIPNDGSRDSRVAKRERSVDEIRYIDKTTGKTTAVLKRTDTYVIAEPEDVASVGGHQSLLLDSVNDDYSNMVFGNLLDLESSVDAVGAVGHHGRRLLNAGHSILSNAVGFSSSGVHTAGKSHEVLRDGHGLNDALLNGKVHDAKALETGFVEGHHGSAEGDKANVGGDPAYNSSLEILLHIGCFGNKFSVCLGFLIVYLYSVEIYPTSCRTTGTSLCLASGRLGSILCPLVYEYCAQFNPLFFFCLMILLMFINFLMLMLLPLAETAGAPLPEDDEMLPLMGGANKEKKDADEARYVPYYKECLMRAKA